MPALNFQSRFAALVESGEKRQTIRAYRKDGRDPKPGDMLHLYTGMRTKKCRKLGKVRCHSVTPIVFVPGPCGAYTARGHDVWHSALQRPYSDTQERRIAKADGFGSVNEMFAWFRKVHGLPFKGLLIRWGAKPRRRP